MKLYSNEFDQLHLLNDMVNNLLTVNCNNYPLTNVIMTDGGDYILQVALAGYKKENIHLSTKDDHLYLNVEKSELPSGKIIRRDIAGRSIKTYYKLDGLEVDKVSFSDGLLSILLKYPNEKKEKIITID